MGWGSYYLFWLLAPTAIALVSAHPAVLIVGAVALVARRWIPDPYLFFKHLGRVSSLESQIAANPENAVAQRALAVIYLEKRRPRKAIPLLLAALEREPDSGELLYLLGTAHLGARDPEKALAPLVAAVAKGEKLRYGDPYLKAGDALRELERWGEAEDAYERFLKINTSSLEGYCKLAGVREKNQDQAGTRAALDEALSTYRQLTRFARRKQFGWSVWARVYRLFA